MFEPHMSVRQRPVDPSQMYNHSRTRTTSSNVFPSAGTPHHPQQQQQQHHHYQQQQHYAQSPMQLGQPPMTHAQRSASVNTFSTVSSGGMVPPAAYRTSPTADVRRSTSSRSGGAPSHQSSYVALLRRQKATVWSERAQFEDPRIAAQQKAARMRANREIHGSSGYNGGVGGGRTSTGLSSAGGKMSAKIRHNKSSTLLGADSNYVGIGGVPLRLSATEVEPEDSDDDDFGGPANSMRPNHRRTGSSGRSSTASGRRGPPYRTSTGALVPSGSGSGSLHGNTRRYSPNDTPERLDSLVDDTATTGGPVRDDAASGKARSTASGSSAERADNVPDLGGTGRLPANSTSNATITRERSLRNPEDLRRRGSVDERTMTLSTGRLFIANPD
ncbi:hypothetical protein SEUCBS139899_010004 [Sporothrix eucalyptigena]|uniref:Uncharacterized protein n=1 Tax=Sporothrix eucalyptigena TaxID=1812306 RepID=A0ABP0D1A5_9PEZI